MLCFTPLALTHEGSLERSSPTSFTLLAVKYEGIFKGPLTPRSLSSATLRPSVPVPDCFQLSNRKPEIANPLFCAFSRHSSALTRH